MATSTNSTRTAEVLATLNTISDALQLENWDAAITSTADGLAKIQVEMDWCYNTDPTLPIIREYFIILSSSLGAIQYTITEKRKMQVRELIRVLKNTVQEVAKTTAPPIFV
jgi:uncharacterized protein YydD (DUF2326 family)